eukprot:m51a1_g12169 hypothetical protein (643) ;mRNA; r:349-4513
MDRTSDIAIHIDETIAEGILDDLGHSSDRFDKKKFITKATIKGICDSGSNDKFKKPQEQIKQSCWGEFKIINDKVQTFLTFEDRERCRKDKLCFVCQSPNHNKEDCPNVKGKAPMASSTTSPYAPALEVKPSNDPANPLEQIRESDMVEFLCKKGYKVNYASIAVDHIASPTVVHDQAKDDTENPFGDVPTFNNVAMIDLSLFEKIYEPSEATCQNVNAQLDSGADRMMINVKYVKKLQWDNHQAIMFVTHNTPNGEYFLLGLCDVQHFICKFENPPIFEYNHAWNKLVKEQEDPIELPVPTLAPTFQEGQLPPVNIGPLISDNPVYLQRTQELLLRRAAVFRPLDAKPVDYPKKFHIELKPGAIVRGREVLHLSKEDIDFISGETRNWDREAISYLIQPFKEFKNYIDDCIQATNGFETWYKSAEKFLDMCITKNIKLNAPKCFANKDIKESDDQYEFAQRNVVKAAELFPVVQELQKRIEDKHRTRYIASAKGKTSYQPGDYVILWSKRDEKLDLAWSGPFVVIGTHRDSNIIYEIESLVDHVRSTAHVDHLHFFYPGDMTLEQLSKEACNRGEFLIEKVYKYRRKNGKLYFRIKYVDFPDVPDDHPDAWNVYENVRWCAPIKEYMNIHKIAKPKLFKRG